MGFIKKILLALVKSEIVKLKRRIKGKIQDKLTKIKEIHPSTKNEVDKAINELWWEDEEWGD